MTRVCICFYGMVQRSLKYTLRSIEHNIFQILKNNRIEYDIYLHTYDASISNSSRSSEYNVPIDVNDYKLLQPTSYIIESYDDFNNNFNFKAFTEQYKDPWNNNYESFINWIREMNSHSEVTKLWENKKDIYNFCLYLRADLMYVTPLPVQYIMNNLCNHNNVLFTVPWGKYQGLNDLIGIGNCDVMIVWGKRLQYLHEYLATIGNNSEQHVKYVCDKHNVINIDLPMLFYRMRANGFKSYEAWKDPLFNDLKDQCIRDGGEINDNFEPI